MSLNEEPNRPDPILRAFTEMIEATFVKRPTAAEVRAAETEGTLHDLREALRDLDEQITELLGLIHELRRLRRSDTYRPEI